MLFMWNALNSCSPESLQRIIDDCNEVAGATASDLEIDEEVEGDITTSAITTDTNSHNNNNNCSRNHNKNTTIIEPMLGITKLIIGLCHVCLKNVELAIDAFRECIEARADELENDVHVSAFAHYELAMLLLKHRRTREVSQFESLKIINRDIGISIIM
jgi:hypothetical protein